MTEIDFSDWEKLDIKIGKVLTCEKVEGADKLLKLEIDFGSETRQVLTGMAEHFEPKHFIGKEIPVLINLKPKKIRGFESQGMILAADEDGKPTLLHPEEEVPPGTEVH
jgi:methionine--tRNA ligase beta chain